MSSIAGCTAVYRDELPKAVVLANSLRHFHPDATLTILLIDGLAAEAAVPQATLVTLADLGLEPGEEWRWPMLYDRAELRAYSQAALLEMLSRKNSGMVGFLSPSTQLFEALTDIFEKVRTADSVLATEAIENEYGDEGRSFIGVPPGRTDLLRTPESFTVFREPGFAVQYSNLEPAGLTLDHEGYKVDNQALRSFDFRGYDPAKPHLLSRYLGLAPRILLSEFPILLELCDAYRDLLMQAGYSDGRPAEHRFEILPSGLRLDARMVRIYREALSKFRSDASEEPPSPFGPGGEIGFVRWLNEPIDQARKSVTRYMLAVYEDRPDLRSVFPDPTKRDAEALRGWYLNFGAKELDLPAALVPATGVIETIGPAAGSVNVAGYFRAELGIGAAARSLVAALDAVQIPVNTIAFDRTANRLAYPFSDRSSNGAGADINIVCVNPDQIALFADQTGPEFSHGRYNIGVWFWEVEDFPREFHGAFNYVDEVWVASEFMRQTFLKISPKPVFKFRLPVLAPTIDESLPRSQFGLPKEFTFLFSFDFLSVLERKNPLGLIRAFSRAFAPGEGPRLVIKTINGDKRSVEMEKLKYAIRGRPDIVLMDGYLAAIENATLTALSDCYVSLHRSEGFGLTIAEAMALGKPTIATAYSGNLEFMTSENSYLCPAQRCEVGPEREPYPADSHWSEPDEKTAQQLFREIYAHREEARERGRLAAHHIRALFSPAKAGAIIEDRLTKIRRRRGPGRIVRSPEFLEDRIEELERRLGPEGKTGATNT